MRDQVHLSDFFAAPIAKVWQALTDPMQMRQWYFPQMEDFRPKEGFWTHFTVSHGGRDFVHRWQVTKALEPEILAYQWRYDGYPGKSLLEFKLAPEAGGTRVDLVHSGLISFQPEDHPELSSDNFTQGWKNFMHALQNFLSMITIQTTASVKPARAWKLWTEPGHIVNWNFATPEWHCPGAKNDLREGGKFSYGMAARDGSLSFDFEGTYTRIEPHSLIEYDIADGRKVSILLEEFEGGTRITESFEPEQTHPQDMQREGWQSILDNFKRYAESID